MKYGLLTIFFISFCFGEFLETDSILGNSGKLQINDTLVIKIKPVAVSPYYATVFDSSGNILKIWPLDSIQSDSVLYAAFADSARATWKADTSVKARRADTATIALSFINSVATNHYAFKKADGTFDDSMLYQPVQNELYFGNGNTSSSSISPFNNSGNAGSKSQIKFINLQTGYGWYSGFPTLVSTKLSTGGYTGYNKISMRTVSDPSPYTYIDHWTIYEQTGQLVLNDSLFYDIQSEQYRDTWYPVWIKHSGLKITSICQGRQLLFGNSSDSTVDTTGIVYGADDKTTFPSTILTNEIKVGIDSGSVITKIQIDNDPTGQDTLKITSGGRTWFFLPINDPL
ncbi:MAG: hypothetical protein JXB48_21145 [Candidatus Latescibacteria bacterium]|nr:hypothetical protein [Candidatus Latescibacterota bacterium]